MKRTFMEPELKRIELCLSENIADSDGITGGQYATRESEPEGISCTNYYVNTNVKPTGDPVKDAGVSGNYEGISACGISYSARSAILNAAPN